MDLLKFMSAGYADFVVKVSSVESLTMLKPKIETDLGMKVVMAPWLRDHFENNGYSPDSDELTTLMAESEMVKGGVKCIRPSLEVCLAMSSIEIRMSLEDYAQPYHGMGVIIPGALLGKAEDKLSVMWWRPNVGLYVCMRDGTYLIHHLVGANWKGTIEELIANKSEHSNNIINDSEQKQSLEIFRICLNLALFAMRDHRLVPLAPDAEKRRARAPRDERFARLAARDIQEVIIQDLDLVVAESSGDSEYPSDGKWKQAPNRRRGHWKMQPYGPGSELRKRIYVASYLVNAEGHRIDTQLS